MGITNKTSHHLSFPNSYFLSSLIFIKKGDIFNVFQKGLETHTLMDLQPFNSMLSPSISMLWIHFTSFFFSEWLFTEKSFFFFIPRWTVQAGRDSIRIQIVVSSLIMIENYSLPFMWRVNTLRLWWKTHFAGWKGKKDWKNKKSSQSPRHGAVSVFKDG